MVLPEISTRRDSRNLSIDVFNTELQPGHRRPADGPLRPGPRPPPGRPRRPGILEPPAGGRRGPPDRGLAAGLPCALRRGPHRRDELLPEDRQLRSQAGHSDGDMVRYGYGQVLASYLGTREELFKLIQPL